MQLNKGQIAGIFCLLFSAVASAQQPGLMVRGNLLKVPQYETTAPLTLFVGSAGSDSSACTSQASPCLTAQGAEARIPMLVRHPVTVTFIAGTTPTPATYAGWYSIGHVFQPATAAAGAYIQYLSTMITSGVATGTATGTATAGTAGSGNTYGTLTDSGQTWTVNNLRGKVIAITGGTGSGQNRIIASNTATAITIVGTWTAPVAASSTYAIQVSGATISSSTASSPAFPNVAAATQAAVYIAGSAAYLRPAAGNYTFTNLTIAPATGDGLRLLGPVSAQIDLTNFAPVAASSVGIRTLGGGEILSMDDVAFVPSTTGGGLALGGSGNSAGFTAAVDINRTLITGSAATSTGAAIASQGLGYFIATAMQIDNFRTGIQLLGPIQQSASATTNVKIDCASIAASVGVSMSASSGTITPNSPSSLYVATMDVSNCVTGLNINANTRHAVMTTLTGSGNTTAISVTAGAKIQLGSASTITGTTELSIDGTAYTVTAMRGFSPKAITNLTYGSSVYE